MQNYIVQATILSQFDYQNPRNRGVICLLLVGTFFFEFVLEIHKAVVLW